MDASSIISYPGKLNEVLFAFFEALGADAGSVLWRFFYILVAFLLLFSVYRFRNRKNGLSVKPDFLSSDIFFALVMSVGAVLIRAPSFALSQFSPDDTQALVSTAALARNPIFWSSTDGTTVGPIAYYNLLPSYWIFGVLNFSTTRLFFVIVNIIPAFLFLYFGLKEILRADLARIAIIPLYVCYVMNSGFCLITYNGEIPVFTLFSVAFFFYLRYKNSPEKSYLLFLSALFAGSAPYAKLQCAPIAAAFLLLAATLIYSNCRSCSSVPCYFAFPLAFRPNGILLAIIHIKQHLLYEYRNGLAWNFFCMGYCLRHFLAFYRFF
jgi:hypothetical protein